MSKVLILGSAPSAVEAANWRWDSFDHVVVINNAWRIRDDWSHLIHPEDFPEDRRPVSLLPGQKMVTYRDYVPAQNRQGGFVYAGGTMAFTAGYWALDALKPSLLCYFGCDMVYPKEGNTHFYGTGAADPLRADVTLANLPAKARRLQYFAARIGCTVVNLSPYESVLPFPRLKPEEVVRARPEPVQPTAEQGDAALELERQAGYFVVSGRYWEAEEKFSQERIAAIDAAWLLVYGASSVDAA